MVPQAGQVVPAVPSSTAWRAACRRVRHSATRRICRRELLALSPHEREQKRWCCPLARARKALPHVSQCRSSPILGTLIWYLFRYKVRCLRLQICALTLVPSVRPAFGRAVPVGRAEWRKHGATARACGLLRVGTPPPAINALPAFSRAVVAIRAERREHGAAAQAYRAGGAPLGGPNGCLPAGAPFGGALHLLL